MSGRLLVPVTSRDHRKGPAEAGLTLVEYGDFECAHCALAHPVITAIAGELPDMLQVVFRHFPLPNHPRAGPAAQAAEAAASQGKFWEMADLLYAQSDDLPEDLTRLAKKARLDVRQFTRELEKGIHRDRVRADYLGGRRSGVKGTPTLFINGERYQGRLDTESLVAALLTASRGR